MRSQLTKSHTEVKELELKVVEAKRMKEEMKNQKTIESKQKSDAVVVQPVV